MFIKYKTQLIRVAAIILIATPCMQSYAQEWGRFIGEVEVIWLENGRKMQLIKNFQYIAPDNTAWTAPKGLVIDGATIPRVAWSIIGGPFEGLYRKASVIHDAACVARQQTWQSTHKAFYTAMLASGVDPTKAKIMYAAVYHFGPRWGTIEKITIAKTSPSELSKRIESINSQPERITKISQQGTIDSTSRTRRDGEYVTDNNEVIIKNVEIEILESPRESSEADFNKIMNAIKEKDLPISEIETFRFVK